VSLDGGVFDTRELSDDAANASCAPPSPHLPDVRRSRPHQGDPARRGRHQGAGSPSCSGRSACSACSPASCCWSTCSSCSPRSARPSSGCCGRSGSPGAGSPGRSRSRARLRARSPPPSAPSSASASAGSSPSWPGTPSATPVSGGPIPLVVEPASLATGAMIGSGDLAGDRLGDQPAHRTAQRRPRDPRPARTAASPGPSPHTCSVRDRDCRRRVTRGRRRTSRPARHCSCWRPRRGLRGHAAGCAGWWASVPRGWLVGVVVLGWALGIVPLFPAIMNV
jgi:hypothetical protein